MVNINKNDKNILKYIYYFEYRKFNAYHIREIGNIFV